VGFQRGRAGNRRAAPGLLISNHSYGNLAGWRLNQTSNVWEFWGAHDQNEDAKFGQYTEEARDWDVIAYNNPHYLIAKSSGNNRSQNGPPWASRTRGSTPRA
jgi:hypothetical protein